MDDLFQRCVNFRQYSDGSAVYECKLHFWAVSGPSKSFIEQEARNYWRKYWLDGEYDELLRKDPQ